MIPSPAPFLLSILTLTLLTTLTNSHFIHNFCETTKYHSKESNNDANLNLLVSSLVLKTPKTGFSTASIGELPNRVYGLALCRSDISEDDCSSCLNASSSHLVQLCPYPKGGVVWYGHCAVRYSIRNFFSQLWMPDKGCNGANPICTQEGPAFPVRYFINSFLFQLPEPDNACNGIYGICTLVGTANPDQFYKNLMSMFRSISKIAVFNESASMHATGVNAQTYAMVQCTRDLSDQQCFKCLDLLFSTNGLKTCGMDGTFVTWSCMVMYSRGKFFNSDPSWVAPPDHYRIITTGGSNLSSIGHPNPSSQWNRFLGAMFG